MISYYTGSFKPHGSDKMMVEVELNIVLSEATGVVHTISVPAGFIFDGATIPKIAWLIIGPPFKPDFILAACIHDWYCTNAITYNDRVIGDAVFFKILADEEVPYWRRALMYLAVRTYTFSHKHHESPQ